MSDPQEKSHIILKVWCFILGLALLITGAFYVIGGGKLISLGGSWYFLIAGLMITTSAFFMFKKKSNRGLVICFGLHWYCYLGVN